MTPTQQHDQAVKFVGQWTGHGNEKSEAQRFWLQLSAEVLGVGDPFGFDSFDAEHKDAKGGFADVMLPTLGLLVEQKSSGVDLDKAEERQGRMVTPAQQALDYNNSFPPSQRQRIVCTCNFDRFRFYDLESDPLLKGAPYAEFTLEELPDNLHVFRTLMHDHANPEARIAENRRVDLEAARRVATLHGELSRFYHDPDNPVEHHALALATVRLVFLYYAEDSGLLKANQFTDYVESLPANWLGSGLRGLFAWVDKTPDERAREYPNPTLAAFPYIDGGLFHEDIPVPAVDEGFRQALLSMGREFDWSGISPVVFGSLMEETLSHDQRRKGGMHYTSPANIHRLIDPLFLDGLKAELKTLTDQYDDRNISPQKRTAIIARLKAFQDRLAGLQFLDPACGSGNFLTETFLQLRALEDEILIRTERGVVGFDLGEEYQPVKVSIRQFHGIEINDFACSVARTALWIAEQQALDRTEVLCAQSYGRLPLTDSGDIICANALQTDWNTLLPGDQCDYVMGNPPFIGQYLMTDDQKQDMRLVFGKDYDGYLDYATGWHRKASEYLADNPNGIFAFVSTNSICQGQPVPALFKPLLADGWHITFAHRTFQWDAQSTDNAHVHVIIVGMSRQDSKTLDRRLYEYPDITGQPVETHPTNINAYLIDAPDVFVEKRSQKSGTLSPMLSLANRGSQPTDNGNLTLDDRVAYEAAMADPIAAKYVRPFRMGRELINKIDRWCLWLADVQPGELRKSKFLNDRIEAVRVKRLSSTKAATRMKADTPWLFDENHQPFVPYLAIPAVFSGRREYATCDWYTPNIIAGNKIYTCIDPDGFNFAIIESSMFMAWQKAIGGRLKSDPNFSNTVVWNTLPLPQLDDTARRQVIAAGRKVLDARRNHPDSSLADLYDPLVMPADLRKAHRELDKVVDLAFGASRPCESNDERLGILFANYDRMTREEAAR